MSVTTPMHRTQHAVCLTGLERSFTEVGNNVREGLLTLLGSPNFTIFGVRPAQDPWGLIHRLLPVDIVELQRKPSCWSKADFNLTTRWMHCDMKSRSTDCRAGFLTMLCDLSHCEQMIQAHEQASGWRFRTVVRLRPDAFWESRIRMPGQLATNTIYMPEADSQGGVNDHFAFGDRSSMARYLQRTSLVGRAEELSARFQKEQRSKRQLKGSNSEAFLQLALHWEGLRAERLGDWIYCLHTRPQLQKFFGVRGCIGRVRCRTRCASLVCGTSGQKSGDCACFNATCADVRLSASRKTDTAVPYIPYDGKTGQARYTMFSTTNRQSPAGVCVDVGSTQLMHACPRRPGSSPQSGCGDACAWPRDQDGTALTYAENADLPDCMFVDRQAPFRDAATRGRCYVTRQTMFRNGSGLWPGGGDRFDGVYWES